MKDTLSPITERRPIDGDLRDRLAGMGIVMVECDVHGSMIPSDEAAGSGWLVRLLTASPLLRAALQQRLSHESASSDERPVELLPGVWACAYAVRARRRTTGFWVALVPTRLLLESEHFIALCQSAQLDVQLVRSLLAQLPPPRVHDIPRFASFIRMLHDERTRRALDAANVEAIGKQLADCYEEMNLLYTIIQKMTVQQKPERFVELVCSELLQTLPYGWCAAMFSEHAVCPNNLVVKGVFPGGPDAMKQRAGAQAAGLLARSDFNAPCVIDGALLADHGHASGASSSAGMIAAPIGNAAKRIGVLLVGSKHSDDPHPSSIDLKLLGAAAGNLSIFLENAALYDDLNAMFLGTLEALTAAIDAKDRYTCGHSQRVALLTQHLARAIGMDEESIGRMRIAGLVHDVGKIGVPEAVLSKPGKLTDEEFGLIRMHPEIGHRILRDIPQLRDVLGGVLHHHERWDGRGYPTGLNGEAIPLVARLIGLADSFDAMSSTRTYRSALTREAVLAEITRCAGAQFDPELARLFVRLDFTEYDALVAEHRAGAVAAAGSLPPHTDHSASLGSVGGVARSGGRAA